MKMIAFFLLAHLILALVSGFAEAGGGISTTVLTSAIDSDDTTASVRTTQGFLKSDLIQIGDETIKFIGTTSTTFTNLERGYDGTTATGHSAGSKVFTADAHPLNSALGFNVLASGDTVGELNVISMGWQFLTTTLPRFVTWDYGILNVGAMQYVRVALQILGGAFIFYVAVSLVASFGKP